jgi:hypothetical protein
LAQILKAKAEGQITEKTTAKRKEFEPLINTNGHEFLRAKTKNLPQRKKANEHDVHSPLHYYLSFKLSR